MNTSLNTPLVYSNVNIIAFLKYFSCHQIEFYVKTYYILKFKNKWLIYFAVIEGIKKLFNINKVFKTSAFCL